MLFKKKFVQRFYPRHSLNKTINFGENLEFSLTAECLSSNNYIYHLENQKGDFEVVKIKLTHYQYGRPHITELLYDSDLKKFEYTGNNCSLTSDSIEFEILANIEYKKMNYVKDSYKLSVPSEHLRMLDLNEYEEREIILQNYPYLKFNCYIKKQSVYGTTEVHIVNPYNLKIGAVDLLYPTNPKIIEGKKGDFKFETIHALNLDLELSFCFDPSDVNDTIEAVESRPESVLPF